jgi:hypothetical protein
MALENLESCQDGIREKIRDLLPIAVGEKEIYPLVKVVEIEQTSFHAQYIEPIALVVVENDEKYLIPLDGEELSPDLLDLVR